MSRRLVGWLKRRFRPIDPPQEPRRSPDGDLSNGFGARRLLCSPLVPGGDPGPLPRASVLEGVQLLTRYCAMERPYWQGFLQHYHDLGVRRIQVGVQRQEEARELEAIPVPEGMTLRLHRLPVDQDPSAALQALPVALFAEEAPFTLMLDADEWLLPLRPDLSIQQLAQVFPAVCQWYVPWLLRPCLEPSDAGRGGFWGHVGKPLIRSECMAGVAHDHSFRLQKQRCPTGTSSAPAGLFGFALVHFWSRSFRDCLVKTFHSRIQDAKSVDQADALALIQAGGLPVRLRLLAYLMVQSGYVPLPNSLRPQVDLEREDRLVRLWVSARDETLCRQSFDRYCEQLRQCGPSLPLYPALTLLAVAERLPRVTIPAEAQAQAKRA
jgi:hypothetical protein